MSDSGKYLGYDEDVAKWKEQDMERLAEEMLKLRKENEQLKQQIRDLTCHPLQRIDWCNSCGSPVIGRFLDHVCKR